MDGIIWVDVQFLVEEEGKHGGETVTTQHQLMEEEAALATVKNPGHVILIAAQVCVHRTYPIHYYIYIIIEHSSIQGWPKKYGHPFINDHLMNQ